MTIREFTRAAARRGRNNSTFNITGKTVSAFLDGDDAVRLEIQDAIAKALKLRRTIDFEPLEIDRGFADTVAEAGVKYSMLTGGIFEIDEINESDLPKVKMMLGKYLEMGARAGAEMAKEFEPKEKK